MKKCLFLAISLIIILFGNCNLAFISYKDWLNKTNSSNDVDIYIGGDCENGADSYPCYWKNGARVDLPYEYSNNDGNGTLNCVYSIFVDGNDVYCGGSYIIDNILYNNNACYWKNGVLNKVNSNSTASGINSICVINGVVFSAGYDNNACFWINGKEYPLPMPSNYSNSSTAKSIAVDKDTFDFYIAGSVWNISGGAACYWKNGKDCILLDNISSSSTQANSVIFSNGKLYIGGSNNVATFFPGIGITEKKPPIWIIPQPD